MSPGLENLFIDKIIIYSFITRTKFFQAKQAVYALTENLWLVRKQTFSFSLILLLVGFWRRVKMAVVQKTATCEFNWHLLYYEFSFLLVIIVCVCFVISPKYN